MGPGSNRFAPTPRTGRRIALLAAVALLLPAPARAGAREAEAGWRSGEGYLMVGGRQLDVAGLNEVARVSGAPDLDPVAVSIGGGGHFTFGRFLVGGEGHGVFAPGGEAREMELGGGYGLLRAGWLVTRSEHLQVYPLLGVGGGGLGARLRRSGPGDRRREHSAGGLLAELGLGVETRFPLARRDDHTGFFLVGLRAGYTFAPIPDQWNMEIGGARRPVGFEGGSLRLVIGFGGHATGPRSEGGLP